MRVKTPLLNFYVDRLKEGEPYAFARYGNGEWDCIFQRNERTGTGSQDLRISALRQGLIDSIRAHQGDSSYLLAMQSRGYLARCKLLSPAEKWLHLNAPVAQWVCGEVFTHASKGGTLYPLIAQLRKMNLIVVGPPYLKGLEREVFPKMKHVFVRPRDCFVTYKDLHAGIVRAIKSCESPTVVSFSAGPTAKVLIHQLYERGGKGCFLIDFGSLWDIYVGKQTRRYHKYVTPEVMRRNLFGGK